jgi:uncharacterized protein (DUF983 family)
MPILGKGSWLNAVGLMKCPRCQEGDLYPTATFSFKKPFDMNEKCANCGQKYVLEAGFYYGAMFVSYVITAFFMFGTFGIFKFGFKMSVGMSFLAAMIAVFILFVWFFRVSRAIWLAFFVKYEKQR